MATAGVGVVVVALALPFRRSQTLRSQIDHHVRLLQRGVRPSTDAVTELCSLLRIGLGSAGMFAIPIVQPDKCERALYLYGHTSDRRDLLPLLEEARARLRWFGRTEPVRRLNLSTLRELGDELRDRPPHERPGPVQIATFGIVLELTRRPYDDVLALIEPVWQLACQAGTPAEHDRCLREMGDLSDRLKV